MFNFRKLFLLCIVVLSLLSYANANFRIVCQMNFFNGCGTNINKFSNIYKFSELDEVHMDQRCNMCTNNECLISVPYTQDDDLIFTYICVQDNTKYLVGAHEGSIVQKAIRAKFDIFSSANATEAYGPSNICVISVSGFCMPY